MASEPVARAVAEELARWGGMRQTGVSLRYMTEFGARPTHRNLLLSAQFLHKELPIRIARRALDLESLPFGLSKKPAVLKVGQSIQSLARLLLPLVFRNFGKSGLIPPACGFPFASHRLLFRF
jgi:hypothetical protein